MLRKIISMVLMFGLCFQQLSFAQVAAELNIGGYLTRMHSAMTIDKFRPMHLRYFNYDINSHNFKVLIDKGDALKGLVTEGLPAGRQGTDLQQMLKDETKTLLNYFLVGLTLRNESFWVNLRPDSEDQIIDNYLVRTDVGRIMLEADLQLKKDTARLTSPQTPEGKEYWNKLYKKAEEIYGYENITIPTLTRPWIVPGEIIIHETANSAYIYKATLKVMLEQDYLKDSSVYNFKDARSKALNDYSSELIRELIIPKLTKEVNSSKRYANMRQVYYSLILSRWFKNKFAGQAGGYASRINTLDLTNLTSQKPWSKTTYFKEYQKSFKEGEYNIKEPVYTPTGQVIRSYFSGGIQMSSSPVINKPGGFNTKSFRENQLSRLGDLVGGNAINGITSAAGSPLTYVFEFTVSFRPSYKHERVEFKANYFEQGKIGERDYKRDVYNPLEITRFIQEKLEEAKKQHGVTGEVRLGNIILDKDLVLTIFPGKKDVDVYEIGKGILTAAAEKVKNDLSVSSKTRKVAAGSPLENRARISAKLGELRQNSGLPIATTIAKVPIEASDNALWAETLRALRFESPVYRRVERVGSVKKADFSKLSLNKNALFENLKDNGYIDKNGEIQAKFPKLEDYKSMNLDFAYESMKEKIYAILKEHLEERYTGVLAFTNADEDKDIRGLTEYDVSTKEFYSIRKGEDVRGFILNPNADIPPEAYFMHRGVFASREDTQKAFYDNKIRFDITVILPAMWGVDFAKTVGHYHDPVEMPEIYQVVSGEVLWLMQKCDEKGNVTEFITVKAKAGDIAIMLPGYGHVSVNLSETEPLVLANWLTWHQSSYYGSFKEKRGAAYYVIKNNQGQPELRPNQEYLKTQGTLPQPQQMVSKDEIPIFGLTRGTPIYNLVKLSDKEFEQKVRFLNYPKQFTNSLIPKETLNDARPADKIEVSSSSPLKRNDKSRFFSETIKQIQELVSQLSTDETGSSSDDLAKKLKIEITPEIAEYKLREGYVKRYVEMAMGALKIVSQLKKEKIGLTDLLSSLDKLALSVLEITDLIKSRDYTEQAIEENSPRMKESAALLSQKLLEIGRNLEAKQYFLSFSPRIQEVIDKLFNEIVLADSLQDFRLEDLIIARDALKNMPQQLMPEQDRINGLLLMLSQIIEQREKDSTHKSANAEEDKISKLNEEIKKNEEEGRAGYEEFIKIKKINMLEAVLFQRKNEPQDSADSLKPEQIHKGVPEVLKQLDDVDLNTVASERSYFPEQNAVTIAKYSERLRPFDLKTLQESIGILQQMLSKTQQASSAVQGLKDLKKWFIDRISSPDIDDPIFGLKESTEFTRVKTFTQLRDFLTNLKAKVEQQIRLEQNREVAYKNNQNAEKAKEASDYIRRLIIELGAITHIKYRVDYELSKRSSSSAVQAVEKTGGIDFRALPMTIKPMGSFEGLNLKLPQLTPEALAGFNLSEEIGQMNQMISGGIIPSGARVQELVAAAWQKGVMEKYQTEILTILAEICKLQEGDCCEASDELKVALVAANAV